jgi:hypothetical protein
MSLLLSKEIVVARKGPRNQQRNKANNFWQIYGLPSMSYIFFGWEYKVGHVGNSA